MSVPIILLVDDDRLILATLSKSLQNAGYVVEVADSGKSALALVREKKYDLAVLDMRMPGLSGSETAKIMRESFGLSVLFLSAFDDKNLLDQAITEGGLGYIIKPADSHQLIPAIETALARARDIAALRESKNQLERALVGGRSISVAVGILMERFHLTENAAFETLRNNARKRQKKMGEYSSELVTIVEKLNEIEPFAHDQKSK